MSFGWGQNITETYMYDYGIDNYYQPTRSEIITSRLLPPCDEGYSEIDEECYYQSDLDVLQIFIDNSFPDLGIEPNELGIQVWENGRIVEFYDWYSREEPFTWNNWNSLPLLS